jgi:hypothetical protein
MGQQNPVAPTETAQSSCCPPGRARSSARCRTRDAPKPRSPSLKTTLGARPASVRLPPSRQFIRLGNPHVGACRRHDGNNPGGHTHRHAYAQRVLQSAPINPIAPGDGAPPVSHGAGTAPIPAESARAPAAFCEGLSRTAPDAALLRRGQGCSRSSRNGHRQDSPPALTLASTRPNIIRNFKPR